MNKNEIAVFQKHFNRFIKIDRDIDSFVPPLAQQLKTAADEGKLNNDVLVISGNNIETENFISMLAVLLQKRFPDNFIFRIDVKKLMDEGNLGLIELYRKYFTYCSILAVVNADSINSNEKAKKVINSILGELHVNTQVIIGKNGNDVLDIPVYRDLASKAAMITLEIPREEDKGGQGNEFSNFAKFIHDIKEEAGVKEDLDESEVRDKYIEKLYVWEMKNFNVTRLKNVINEKDLAKIKSEFEDFTAKVRKLMVLHKEYGVLNTAHFRDDAQEIESLLFDPDSCDEIEKKINILKEKINYFRFFRRHIRTDMDFKQFIPDATNRSAYDKISQIISKENTDILVTITGSAGTGKTHLLNGLVNILTDDKVIMLNKKNFGDALREEYLLSHLREMDMLLIDDFDDIYNAAENKRIFRKIIINSIPKVITMHRKYSIEDKELLEYLNQYPTLNIQPPSLFIEKSIIKSMLAQYGIPIDEIMLNYIIDNISVPLSHAEQYIERLGAMTKGNMPDINQIHEVFPKTHKEKKRVKSKFDTSNLIKTWTNEHDRLYVEFED